MATTKTTIWKVFISSTYEDMIPYRNAASEAITSIEHLPIGMEHFVSSPEKPLDASLADVRRCNLYVLLVGMRYGTIDEKTGKSYTELEYEEALRNNIPVLAFLIDENECPVLPKYCDTGEKAEILKTFKKRLNEAHVTARFKSSNDLKQLIIRAIEAQVKGAVENEKNAEKLSQPDKYLEGAQVFKKFILLPERYKNEEVILRIRIDGPYGSWKQRDALFEAYSLPPGDTLRINDVTALGIDLSDVDADAGTIDLYAEGKNADWIIDAGASMGSIVEGKFRLLYENVKGITSTGDAKIAAVLIIEGRSVNNRKRRNH